MAARDRGHKTIRCPACSSEETVNVSEDDHPWQRDPGFRFDDEPSKFRVLQTSFYPRENRIRCLSCGEEFWLQGGSFS